MHFPTTNWATDKNCLLKKEEKVKEHNAKNLIRLLTRLLFVWFVKEKNLVPDELFDESYIKDNLLNGFEPRKKKGFDHKTLSSKYYRGILQNLFFATLNQTVGKREFRKDGAHMNVTNLMRYESYFKNPQAFIKLVEDIVPFMNGGLFECLDSPDPVLKGKKGGDVIIYEDGFSDRKDNTLCVPDYIFFGTAELADLSVELGDKKQKDVTVNGLINILKSYKFTVTENTPIEEDIALDPELLGRVFENLLASYNPETKTTARTQTGSFYTPREIVNYMVDESLKAYLKQKLESEAGMKPEDAEVGLEFLVGYNEKTHVFDARQTAVLINAIDNCKILDPACGSGAFPMGILHKLVHILHKLDPNNETWKEVQRKKAIRETEEAFNIGNKEDRENRLKDISGVFEDNSDDYGRKLYLIENCIYGVDIQPIATQISKLRFFISLIVDQKANKNKENFGIRPLPNLETKFVAANTLIGIDKPKDGDLVGSIFDNPKVQALEIKLKDIRHRLFLAKTPATKRKLREEDQRIREEMGALLVQSGWGNESAHQLSAWDPYNQNVSSGWFEAEWMFGIENGFDVVIGNPPYGATVSQSEKKYYQSNYLSSKTIKDVQKGSLDTFSVFIENGYNNLKLKGNLHFIVPMAVTSSDSMTGLHRLLEENCKTIRISSYSNRPKQVFDNACIRTSIIFFERTNSRTKHVYTTKMIRRRYADELDTLINGLQFVDSYKYRLSGRYPKIGSVNEIHILGKIFSKGRALRKLIDPIKGKPIFYRTAGGRYFNVITNYLTGSTQEKPIILSKEIADVIAAILSSNLFYFYQQVYTDGLHIKQFEIESFPIPTDISESRIKDIENLYRLYLEDIEKNATRRTANAYANIDSFKEYKIVKSKQLIDKIDDLIGPLYGLTIEEIEFIKNYELEFRLGGDKDVRPTIPDKMNKKVKCQSREELSSVH